MDNNIINFKYSNIFGRVKKPYLPIDKSDISYYRPWKYPLTKSMQRATFFARKMNII